MDFTTAHPILQRALTEHGYATATAVQEAMLDEGIRGLDLLVSAQTGSGKTVAFGLAMAEQLLGDAGRLPRPGAPLALVIAPTRELALQVRRELVWLYAPAEARIASTVGGMSVRSEQHLLDSGVHLVVGTPGRLCDHLDQGHLDLSELRVVVLDEADEMLDMGFRDDLEKLLAASPAGRRTLFFSATLPEGIEHLASRYGRSPKRIRVTPAGEAHADIDYRAVATVPNEREAVIVNILRLFDARSTLVFCATREGVEHLRVRLVERGFAASSISGDLTQAERNRALDALRRGQARVLVATDVAARGLDLPDLDLVIQADLPLDGSVFQHRCGRTGRAGRKGTAVTLVPVARRRQAERLFREAGVEPGWSPPPSVDLILARDRERMAAEITTLCADVGEEDHAAAEAILASHPPEALVGALIRMLRQRLPEPEDTPETTWFLERARAPAPPGPPRSVAFPRRPIISTERASQDRAEHERTATADRAPTERPPVDRPPVDRAPVERAPSERPAYERAPAARPPFERPGYERPGFERPGFERNERPYGRPDRDGQGERTFRAPIRSEDTRPTRPAADPTEPPRRPADPNQGAWFRVNVGRAESADPRWILPMLCRRGRVDREAIGQIRVLDHETHFTIDPSVADRFIACARRPDRREPWVRIGIVESE